MLTDLNFWRSLSTVLAFVCFIGIVVWVWRKGRNRGFKDAAELPFDAEDTPTSKEPGDSTQGKQHD